MVRLLVRVKYKKACVYAASLKSNYYKKSEVVIKKFFHAFFQESFF